MAVHPRFFRKGIAGQLIDFIESLNGDVNRIIVCTGKENLPAVTLYFKKGYSKTRDIEVSEGMYLTMFEKMR